MIELRCRFCLHEGLCTPYPDPVCIYMSVGVAHYMNMLTDNYLKMEKLFASALLQEAIQTHVFFLPSCFPPTPCRTPRLWNLSDTKLKSGCYCLLVACVQHRECVCVVGGVQVCFSATANLKSYFVSGIGCTYTHN